ncbi:YhdH/YhfP family quinone oxidoreductase [Thiopseudomonas denitrificans]|uniref:Putative YhdH/YhfP family quinone oxidoreductase n=1 Tax=Thiopseudomonas denitrificans TaxID=1501432 RepID=A0A4R6U216_9GAMM|nr:YhdH/YhfP family quinone oxidoreductase [Thiopseudomonas denitrificans]TDQ39981.1 putative YhdH/YhfP family quinone oxidoreductase [Thiopseudomonas denitrificans]
MTTYRALWVTEEPQFKQQVIRRDLDELPAGEVLVRVHYSSLNYKDALSATGNRGVTRNFPHTPGIDAAGVVEHSTAEGFVPGDEVIVTGYDLGMNTYGGLADYIRVPASWLIKRPAGLSLREAMILGTAGFTAGLCVYKLVRAGLQTGDGDVLVTGATGGVGSVAVKLLSQLGYRVVAATGKADQIPFLQELGAAEVIDRAELGEGTDRPMLKSRWAAAVDTVGGDVLFNVVKSLNYGGSVACCGLTAGTHFNGNVFPFILRGANLLGVDSVELPLVAKASMWDMLSLQWKMDLEPLVDEISLEDTPQAIARILAGHQKGRVLVNVIG